MKIQRLQPEAFTYGKYNLLNLSYNTIKSTKDYIEYLLTLNIIGYCESENCTIRPRPDDMAVMIDDDGFETWIHIPKDVWKEFVKLPEK